MRLPRRDDDGPVEGHRACDLEGERDRRGIALGDLNRRQHGVLARDVAALGAEVEAEIEVIGRVVADVHGGRGEARGLAEGLNLERCRRPGEDRRDRDRRVGPLTLPQTHGRALRLRDDELAAVGDEARDREVALRHEQGRRVGGVVGQGEAAVGKVGGDVRHGCLLALLSDDEPNGVGSGCARVFGDPEAAIGGDIEAGGAQVHSERHARREDDAVLVVLEEIEATRAAAIDRDLAARALDHETLQLVGVDGLPEDVGQSARGEQVVGLVLARGEGVAFQENAVDLA